MKYRRLYTKIFLSFLGVLIVIEILVFTLFHFYGRMNLRSRIEQYLSAQALIIKELVKERISSDLHIPLTENESMIQTINYFGEIYGAQVWLASSDGKTLVKSFTGNIPDYIEKISEKREETFEHFTLYYNFRKRHAFYVIIPIEIGNDTIGNVHMFVEEIKTADHERVFVLGLVGIGIVIALLVIPVSRAITNPIKQLSHSALHIAEGNLSHRASIKSKDEIGELGRSFNHMAEKLEKLIQGSRELTTNISHELRSPLARIRIADELIREGWKRGDLKDVDRYLDTMREDIGELNALIGRILILSKLDMHKASQKSEYLHLSGMINELLEKLKPFIDHKHLHIMKDLSVDPPVFGNKDSLRMALSNILDNAVKFTPENGEIYVEMHQEQNDLKISVTNSSIPLSEEDLEKIFEPFYRIDQSPPSGSGLGLAIAKKIIENHHGCIEASNTEGGIKILICLPTCSSE